MAIWRWITGRLSVTQGLENWRAIYGHEDDTGQHVSYDTALKLSSWWSSVRLITETISTLPLSIYKKKGDDREADNDHPLYRLLHDQPNLSQTPVEWWEGRIGPLCMVGNSYSEKKFIGPRLVALEPLPHTNVSPFRRTSDGAFMYRIVDRGKTYELPPEKVFHIKGFAPNDEDMGLSPVEYAARSLGGAMAAERASARVYSRGMRAQGFFVPPVNMDKTQREDFIKNYVTPGEGVSGEGKTLVFPPGFDWKTMNISPRDAEMIMSRSFNVEDVCRWMRVPPILIGHAAEGQTMWGSGIEQIILGWLVLGLRAYLKRIESAVNTRLLTNIDRANGYSFEFNFEGLLRADSTARAALMSSLAQNGLRNRNELRKIDNYPSIGPDGDIFTAQANLTPLGMLGQKPQAPVADTIREELKAWLAAERGQPQQPISVAVNNSPPVRGVEKTVVTKYNKEGRILEFERRME